MLEFTTATRRVVEEDEADDPGAIEFNINETDADGEVVNTVMCTAFKPGDGQLAALMAMTSKYNSGPERMAGVVNFFASVLDNDSHTYVVNRLFDRRDEFGFEDIDKIMEGLIAEWSGRPTVSPSASSSSRKGSGQKSRPSTRKSISSASPGTSS